MPSGKPIVLVVEDDPSTAALLQAVLEEEAGCRVVAHVDGAVAVAAARAAPPDLVLLDLNLPGLDGAQIYESLHRDRHTARIPVIFLTANPDDPRLRGRRDCAVLAKPFPVEDLLAWVAQALGHA